MSTPPDEAGFGAGGNAGTTPWLVRASARTYRVLLAAFPRRFRARFGPEIARTFEQLAVDAWRERGVRGLGRLWVKTLADLSRHGSGERLGNGNLVSAPSGRSSGPPVQHGGRGTGRRSGLLDSLAQDLLFTGRTVRRAPGFAVAVVATIALGIGANTAIFTVVNGILLRPLPFEGSERVVILCETNARIPDYCTASPPNVDDWSRTSSTIETLGLARNWTFVLQEPERGRALSTAVATPGYFQVHLLVPALGRLFTSEDMEPGSNQVVVLGHAFWRSQFGGDPDIVGEALVLDGRPFTVIGVLPADAWIHNFGNSQIWTPLTTIEDDYNDRGWRGFVALGRLADGSTMAGARDEMETIRTALETDYPGTNEGWGLRIELLRDRVSGSVRSTLLFFLGAVGLVMLIACTNVANLLLVRSTARAQEFAVRASIGAGRIRLARQLFTESLVLAALGGAAGVLLALWTTRAFLALAPQNIPRLEEVAVDGGVLAFAVALTVATAILFGLAPAVSVTHADLSETLKTKRALDGRGHGLRNLLVVAELALAVMLLVGAGLLTRGFAGLLGWDPGFNRENLVMVWGLAPPAKYQSGPEAVGLFERVAEGVRAMPDVEAVGLTSAGPLFGGLETEHIEIEGRPAPSPEDRPSARWYDIGTEYFDAMGIAIVRGRDFEPSDTANAVSVVIVNETFARLHFSGEDPLGKRFKALNGTWETVGVARDVHPFRPDESVGPEFFVPKRQYERWGSYIVLRTRGDPAAIEDAVQAQMRSIDRDFNPGRFRTLDEFAERQLVSPRFNMLLVALFATGALALAAIGTYGVIAYAVASRTHEIGIRMALGAEPRSIRAGVIKRGMMMAGVGLLLGIGGALALSRVMAGLLYGVSPGDPLTMLVVVGLFALVALAACWAPARRASKLDPLAALRAV